MNQTTEYKPYSPAETEDHIYDLWEKSGYFHPETMIEKGLIDEFADPFTIILPPPNVTGTLHTGHALMIAIEDAIIRYQRMQGKRTLWLPGTDHAAIATQSKMEKILAKEGVSKHDLGREEFLKRVNQFAHDSHDTIVHQIRKMGASIDWQREAYTLDEPRSRAVRTAFKKMYDDGLIYRGDRVINWDVKGQTTVSDDEVVHEDTPGKLYTFRYSADFPIPIATTRPETKVGDTAVAVHPDDDRYSEYVGKTFNLDFCGLPLIIRVIADEMVDPAYGTGAVGVTPAHSQIDFELAQKYSLPVIQVIDERGRMMVDHPEIKGKKTPEVREWLVQQLKNNNLLIKEEDITINLSKAQRSGGVIEPLPKKQFFVDVNARVRPLCQGSDPIALKSSSDTTLKKIMQEAVTSGAITIMPEHFTNDYMNWINNLRDWCISRQLWFGHQVPVWYKKTVLTYFAHGSTQDNISGAYGGDPDIELAPKGIEEAKKLHDLLADREFDVVITSDLKRAVRTAELAFTEQSLKIIQDKRLREIDTGTSMSHSEEIMTYHSIHLGEPFPGGESYKDVEERMHSFLEDVKEKYQGKKIAIVTHRLPQLALEVLVHNKTWEQVLVKDWRKQTPKGWQPGWDYVLEEDLIVTTEPPLGEGWVQDPDTLDTWFSSGLWTFSTLGWPFDYAQGKPSGDLKTYHPTDVLETAYDILFFWVARMILMSGYFLGQVPFKTVYLHGLVRDSQGRKMSKSLDNAVDPQKIIDQYGTDALRLAMIFGVGVGGDQNITDEKIRGMRNFVNKLFNISRFIEISVGENVPPVEEPNLSVTDAEFLALAREVQGEMTVYLEKYRLSDALQVGYDFVWNKFASEYLESAKNRLQEGGEDAERIKWVLLKVLFIYLKAFHPFMPFVTESIYQNWRDLAPKWASKDLLLIESWD